MLNKVYIRADGNTDIGLGHVVRCLALAEMLKADFECVFVTRFLSEQLEEEIRRICSDLIKLPETEDHFEIFLSILSGQEIVVLDNYFYTSDFQKSIKDKGCKLVCIDDIHSCHFFADVVINHAGGFTPEDYSVEPHTQLKLGTEYALLRPVFLEAAASKRTISSIENVFVCFGGADKYDLTLKIVNALLATNKWNNIYIVVGQAYLHKSLFEIDDARVKVFRNLSADEMFSLLNKSQLAIVPASTICYEVFAVQMPVVLGYYVDNQEGIYQYFVSQDTVIPADDFHVVSHQRLNDLFLSRIDVSQIKNQHKLIDGKSKQRILDIFKKL